MQNSAQFLVRGLASLSLMLLLLSVPVRAAAPVDLVEFPEPGMLERYNGLLEQLRCPKCLNTNIKGSNAPIAQDLRAAVARLLKDGMTDQQILNFLHERYGDFVLYNPPLKPGTYLLWFGPGLFFLIAALLIWRTVGRAQQPVPELDQAAVTAALSTKASERESGTS